MKRLAIALLFGLMTSSVAPVWAQEPGQPGQGEALTSWGWDLDNDGLFDDAVSFATFLKSGQVIADGIVVRVTDNNCPVRLGNGHGTWLYRQQNQSLLVRTLHATGSTDPDAACGDSLYKAVWEIGGILTPTTGGRFEGKATIKQFASLDDFRAGLPSVWSRTVGVLHDPADPTTK